MSFTVPVDSSTETAILGTVTTETVTAAFRQCCAKRGLTLPSELTLDGEFHRFSTKPGNTSDKAGYYSLSLSPPAGLAGCWRTGTRISFEAFLAGATEQDREAARQEQQRQKAAFRTLKERQQADVRGMAQRLYQAASSDPATVAAHPYLVAKKVAEIAAQAGCRAQKRALLVPLRDETGMIWNLQMIGPDGQKSFMPGGRIKGLVWLVGDGSQVDLCEGPATTLAVALAGNTAACCFGTKNMMGAAATLQGVGKTVRVAADNDPAGLKASQAVNTALGCPVIHPPAEGQDWNDLFCQEGLEVLRAALAGPAQIDWPEPQALPEGVPTVEEFPLALLPEVLQPWISDIADRLQCPPDYPAIGAMIALASIVGRRVGIRPKRFDDWCVTPNLWGAIVGRPGLLKSPALNEAMKPLHRLEALAAEAFEAEKVQREAMEDVREQQKTVRKARIKELLKEGLSPAAIAESVAPDADSAITRRRYVVNDSSVEKLGELLNENPNGLLAFRDELLGLLTNLDREGHEGSRQFYLEAWNGNGRFTYDRIGRGTIDIKACCLSILGGIQPGPLQEYLAGSTDDGLMQRFQLAVWPDAKPQFQNVDRWPDREAKQAAHDLFEQMDGLTALAIGALPGDGPQDVPYLRFDDAAQAEFDTWRIELETRLRSDELTPVMETVLAKQRSLVPALALLIHLADNPAGGPVSHDALLKAAAWAEYLESHARRIYAAHTASADHSVIGLAEKIAAGALPETFTIREVYRKCWRRLDTPGRVKTAADELVSLDWLAVSQETPPRGGRSREVYRVNPRVGRP